MTTETRPPYLDPDAPIEARVRDLLGRMTLAEKAGQLFHTIAPIGPGGALHESTDPIGLPGTEELIVERHMTHFNLLLSASVTELATWHNKLQDLALESRLQIPITISTDPRHAFSHNPGTSAAAGPFSEWPEPIGLAAIGDSALVERFAAIARQEYVAVGLRVALHPQIDLATEPRWCRISGTFGESVELTSVLVAAYIRGFGGDQVGPDSVATMVKHFPGGGPQRDGEDPHFNYGREQIYPGGQFDLHLQPFRAALAAGATQVMPYYGMPIGTDLQEVGFGFNRGVITDLLRGELGFDGIICTDWGLLTDKDFFGEVMLARAWGVEDETPLERTRIALDAGVDQFGGDACPELVIELVEAGAVSAARIDESVTRVLREKFALGLFDTRHVDVAEAERVVGSPAFRAEGHRAQCRAVTVLTNGRDDAPTLPLASGCRLYIEGVDPAVAAEYATIVTTPADADVSILRIKAPYEPRPGIFESFFHAGSLAFPSEALAGLLETIDAGPTVVDIYLDRPAIVTELADRAAALVANFGASDRAILDVVFGVEPAAGRLPFDLPRSMAAVVASRSDVPFDTADPVFPFGHGLELATR
jgi:beta-glucosidase